MKKDETTNTFNEKSAKITLKDYYEGLPKAVCPKKEFLNEVQKRTGMSDSAVKTWIKYGMKPSNPEHIKILSEITGIAEEDLWKD